jgi:endonuclease YncB( thermonuclease family)
VRRAACAFALAVGVSFGGVNAASACPLSRADRAGTVAQVVDGDTLVLQDGTKVRLLGYDAPEPARDAIPAEPYAHAARDRLRALAPPGTALRLGSDAESHDRYGRLLAHVHRADGTDLAETLLREGLGEILILPPNVALADCLAAAEHAARRGGRGVWSLPNHQPRPAGSARFEPGYAVVRGTVTRVTVSRSGVRLLLDDRVALWVPRAQVDAFQPPLATRTGQRATARGIVQVNRRGPSIVVRHPATVEWASAPGRVPAPARAAPSPP